MRFRSAGCICFHGSMPMMLNAVLCVWNEEDIIESTVKHLFAQGCEHVYIIDNASSDKTVEIATKAGALLAASFESKYFDETQKIAHLNAVVKKYNEQSDAEHIWWLYVDADEFPNIDRNLRIIDFLQKLDPSIRAVHGYMFNHIPTHPPYNISGYHPVDFMQLANKSDVYKIPLLRYDKGKPHLYSAGGAHSFDTCGEYISVVTDALHIHHFNYRDKTNTLRRLQQLTTENPDGSRRTDWHDRKEQKRTQSSQAQSMYHNRYEYAKSLYNSTNYKILMTDELGYSYPNIVRWYDQQEFSTIEGTLFNKCLHYYFFKVYDLALCKFNDLLRMTHDYKMKRLIIIKIALCLYDTDKKGALFILQQLLQCPDRELREYAEKQFTRVSEDKVSITKASGPRDFVITKIRSSPGG